MGLLGWLVARCSSFTPSPSKEKELSRRGSLLTGRGRSYRHSRASVLVRQSDLLLWLSLLLLRLLFTQFLRGRTKCSSRSFTVQGSILRKCKQDMRFKGKTFK